MVQHYTQAIQNQSKNMEPVNLNLLMVDLMEMDLFVNRMVMDVIYLNLLMWDLMEMDLL